MMTRDGGRRGRWAWAGGAAVACIAWTVGCAADDGPRAETAGAITLTPVSGTATDATSSGTTEDPASTSNASQGSNPTNPSGSGSTGSCTCDPGTAVGCASVTEREICEEDCVTTRTEECEAPLECVNGNCEQTGCEPGETRCPDDVSFEVCDANGEWGAATACANAEECYAGECLSLCDVIEFAPTSQGCSFRGNSMQTINDGQGALIVGNVSDSLTANVQLYFLENGGETAQGAAVALAPNMTHTFPLTAPKMGYGSVLRTQGSYRVESDLPIIAYQHSPIGAQFDNDASMLLPDHAAGDEFLISAYSPNISGQPTYFNVIALVDGTQVDWTPPVATPAGTGVPAVAAGATGTVMMNGGDTLQVAVYADLTGTRVTSSENVWVVGAVSCVQVPTGTTACDHIEEQQLPLEYWGDTYVAAHAPTRGSENYRWRIFGGDDGVTISANPVQPGFPMTLNDGEWVEITASESFVMTADGPFMPIQYLVGQSGGAGTGDPAMYQMVPVEQFLDRYAFVTGTGYDVHYVQVTREVGGADVSVDGVPVTGYYTVGGYEVADWPVAEGSHFAESADAFGIVSIGYTGFTSYAYPGGLELEVINPG